MFLLLFFKEKDQAQWHDVTISEISLFSILLDGMGMHGNLSSKSWYSYTKPRQIIFNHQCRRARIIYKMLLNCSHVLIIIGRINTIKAALNDSLTSDSLNKHFPTIAVTSSHQSADNYAIPGIPAT